MFAEIFLKLLSRSLLYFFIFSFVFSCTNADEKSDDDTSDAASSRGTIGTIGTTSSSRQAVEENSGSVATSEVIATESPSASEGGSFFLRMSPEQISEHFQQATGYRHGWDLPDGSFEDRLLSSFNIPLGGVDFMISSYRDSSTKVQTILVVRTVAWSFAKQIFWKESSLDEGERLFFTEVSLYEDLPFEGRGIEAWNRQIETIYWRFFSRAPNSYELEKLQSSFRAIWNNNEHEEFYTRLLKSWCGILYSLMSTMEFWNL